MMRGTYGANQPYTKMAARAMELWKEHQQRWKQDLFHQAGVLWMATAGDDAYERTSLPVLREAGVPYQDLSPAEMTKRWPQINVSDVGWGIYEPESGFLCAKDACRAVVGAFVEEGGDYRQAAVAAKAQESEYRDGLKLWDGGSVAADQYVFACGPWLGKLFPESVGNLLQPTKQEVFYFGTPAGDDRFSEPALPVWADHRERFIYGIPAGDSRSFKLADDTRGPSFDPTSGERSIDRENLERIRSYMGFRFPGMKGAPLVETQVCQYENTPDGDFIIDRHPQMENLWILGGGSGHGFKHGPALGEMVAELVMENKHADPRFGLQRFVKAKN